MRDLNILFVIVFQYKYIYEHKEYKNEAKSRKTLPRWFLIINCMVCKDRELLTKTESQ